ncbi:MAG: tRNA (N6-isopentenyl adenosine(37)-C2)-methylthiotransferase MiaB [Alistipes sp.]|nr:tRNA (N6-isopentenyl adenosine(37)-C2)-methylthiotransferase MiaB [Alistipes sp.]
MDYKNIRPAVGVGRTIHIETYGCQMNVVDSETVLAIMQAEGFVWTDDIRAADVILLNTCSIRDNAEQRVWNRLDELCGMKRRRAQGRASVPGGSGISGDSGALGVQGGSGVSGVSEGRSGRKGLVLGLIGCMAERLREQILTQRPAIDIVAGPDAYRSLPGLVADADAGARGVNVELSREETYAEISPVRLDKNGVGAFVSIMRGCNNFCSYCVVPYTRGRERSRDPETILGEVRELFAAGYREVTLLGQNVNSFKYEARCAECEEIITDGAPMVPQSGAREKATEVTNFPRLLARVAAINPLLRVRFATSHPKDISDELLEVMAATPNICRAIHLPAQSGSSLMLDKMNRKYTREWYLERIATIRRAMPDCAISTDLIAGFCGETPEDHLATLSLMREVGYEFAFMFKYSEREGTFAARKMPDDVPEATKTARLDEIIALQNELSLASNRRDVGREFEILVEGASKRSADKVFGRTSQNKVVVIDRLKKSVPGDLISESCGLGEDRVGSGEHKIGDYVRVRVTACSSATLQGEEIV